MLRKLVIVDDDQIILRRLSKGTPWEKHGFQVVAAHTNGEDGLEAIRQLRPQVVLTDIRMPFMDGLELTERLKAELPDIQIIMMTSYDEFEFAQKALKLKVYDFVLKPLEEAKLLETVIRAGDEWEREQDLAKKVMEGVPLLRQRFFENLLYGRYRMDEIKSELGFLGLPLHKRRYAVILLLADDYYETGARNRYGQELLKYCLHNLAQEVLSTGQYGGEGGEGSVVFESIKDEVVILFGSDLEGQELELSALRLSETVRANVQTFLKTTVSIGIGSAGRLDELAGSYRGALAAAEQRHLAGTNQVFLYRDNLVLDREEEAALDSAEWKSELAVKIKSGLEKEAMAVIDRLEEEVLTKTSLPLPRLHLIGMELVFALVNAFHDWKEPPYPANTVELLFGEIRSLRTARDMFGRIRGFAAELSEAVRERRSSNQNQLVDQAVDYIRQNFAKEGLSLQEVAEQVHVSTTYLSTIFKKRMGVNFSDFLTETRMKAAMEWLAREDMRTYEVAERVGYSNPQYFSVSFKKHTGMTPSEFRQSVSGRE